MKLGEKIRLIRNKRQMTMQDLAEKAGMSKGYVSMIEKGINPETKKKLVPGLKKINDIASAFDMTLEELIANTDSEVELPKLAAQRNLTLNQLLIAVVDKLKQHRKERVLTFADGLLDEQRRLSDENNYVDEVLSGYLSAGTGEYLSDEINEDIRIPNSTIPDQKYDLILQVNGDSMTPMFEDGEYVFVRKTNNIDKIRSGQVGVFIVDGESYLKKAYINDDHLRLVSLNPDYPDLTFDSTNEIQPIGIIVL